MPIKRLRGINMAYDDTGSGNPLVFIHGHPFNRSMWKYQAGYFTTKGYRLIAPDLRGYGETGPVGNSVLLDEMALDIAHLLDELAIEQAVFCGLSMGGQVLLDFYRLFPRRVKAIIIADSDARAESADSYKKRLLLAETLLKDGMKKYTDENIYQYIAAGSKHRNPEMYRHLYEMMVNTQAAGAAAAHRGRAERRDHVPLLTAIDVPALIMAGSEDYFTPLPVASIMSDAIPGARLCCIETAGHLPNMETPDAFNEAAEEFLRDNNL